jgi:CubicO group peptidase (beta-lactamase class C family)
MRLITATTIAIAIVSAGTASADPIDDYIRSQLAPRHLPGVALAVIKDGRIVKSAGYGVASLELSVPVTPDTVFEIGSISVVGAGPKSVRPCSCTIYQFISQPLSASLK